MKALIFDTETTGMVKWNLPPEHASQPDLIQLGMLLIETEDWKPRARHSMLVRLADGVSIEPEAQAAHGISAEDCARFGVPATVACSLFNQLCLQADVIVAHNMSFDQSIMLTALYRLGGKPSRFDGKRLICTKDESTDVLKLPGQFDSYKWPTLAEAYRHFAGRDLEGAHDALVDTEACLVVFQGLVDLGVCAFINDVLEPKGRPRPQASGRRLDTILPALVRRLDPGGALMLPVGHEFPTLEPILSTDR